MKDKNLLDNYKKIHTIIFDFDGVFTNNKVFIDQNGIESVICDRSDGLAMDLLRDFVKKKCWDVDFFILSTESNPVVTARAKKLKIKCIHGVKNKLEYLRAYLLEKFLRPDAFDGVVYLGNDLNDFEIMRMCGFSISPSNAHSIIKEISNETFPQSGGDGFVRAFVERVIKIDIMSGDKFNEYIFDS